MPTQVSLLDGALASAGTLAIQTNGTTNAITISSAQVATFVNNPIMTGLTASRAVFTDGSKGLTSNAITGTGNVVMSASPTLTGTIDGAALTLSSSLTLSGGTANGVLYLNGSKVATSGSALTFDGTTVSTTGKFGISGNGAVPTSTAIEIGTNGAGTRLLLNVPTGGEHNFYVNGSLASWVSAASSGWYISGSEAMRLTSTGLGIGTSSPSYKLDVSGVIRSNTGIKSITASGGQPEFVLDQNGVASWTIYNPPSNTALRFYNGVDRMTLDSSGNLGLGVTPSAWNSDYKTTQMGRTASFFGRVNSNQTGLAENAYRDSGGSWRYLTNGTAESYEVDSGAHRWYNAPSGTAGNAISFTQAMTLNAAGNLGLGTTSPSDYGAGFRMLAVSGSSTGIVQVLNSTDSVTTEIESESTRGAVGTRTNHPLVFKTNQTERARIDSSGNLLVGTTSLLTGSPRLNVSSTGSYTATFNQTDNTDRVAIRIQNTYAQSSQNATMIQFVDSGGNERGSIKTTGTATSYNTSSDYRLKENIQPMTGALDKVAQLKPVTYTWKSNGSASQGFIAHELQEVVPDCVTGAKDAVDEDGNPVYQGIDTSFLVATLTAAIQELKAEVDSLKAQLNKGA